MTGEKLPPFIIFKGVPNGRVARELRQADYGTQVVCTVQKSAWMDKATFLHWTNTVWKPFCASSQPTCLIMDPCAILETSAVKETLRRLDTKIQIFHEVIQADYMCLLLALTMLLNSTCASSTRVSWEEVQEKSPDYT